MKDVYTYVPYLMVNWCQDSSIQLIIFIRVIFAALLYKTRGLLPGLLFNHNHLCPSSFGHRVPKLPTSNMSIPLRSMTMIDGEFQRLKVMTEISLNKDLVAFLEDAHLSLKSEGICNPRGPFARSLVHYAAMGDCTELLLYLLQWNRGAAKEDHDQNKRTPLSWAAEYGALRVVKILLENGAEINCMDDMYSTPLSWLIHAGTGTSRTATEAYLRKSGATERGAKRAWILRKLRML